MEKEKTGIWMGEPAYCRIYLAGPFFNKSQAKIIANVEALLRKKTFKTFSPRKFSVLKPKASLAQRRKVFFENLKWIETANLIIACLDFSDSGTHWELGYAYHCGKKVVAFLTSREVKLNVMLAQSFDGVIHGYESLKKFLGGKATGYLDQNHPAQMWDFDWTEAQQWKKEIY